MNDQLLTLREASIRIIKENQADSGAYIASPNFRVYAYSWFRDGAFIAEGMSVSGENESALNFHKWATRVILDREEKVASLIRRKRQGEEIAAEEHLHCRYQTDGQESDEYWTNLQLDGFGTWIWSLDKFRSRGNFLPIATYRAVETLIGYLSTFWDIESYDWWEESFGHQHVANLGSIAAGLKACSTWEDLSTESKDVAGHSAHAILDLINEKGLVDGRLAKWINGKGLDSSLLSLIAPFNLIDGSSSVAQLTVEAVVAELGIFGTYRHKDDGYFGGGRWPLLSCFLGLSLIETGDTVKASEILDWIETLANDNHELPEQLESPLLFPEMRAEWIANWGIPAIPLLWSHAMYLSLYSAVNTALGKE
ncbi:MAG: glycoside hydrolase family 15 protein [Candidatus Nanopelagicaceae bacterium]|nr:glycoside hydrolase family 15 protein [Candidatus Nanopelagicaceae bacterium]